MMSSTAKKCALPVFIGALLAGTTVIASPEHSPSEAPGVFSKKVTAGKAVEDCILVKKDHLLSFEFEADRELRFNLHFHDKATGETVYPVGPVMAVSQPENNKYAAGKAQVMCLMWRNLESVEASLSYSYRLSPITE